MKAAKPLLILTGLILAGGAVLAQGYGSGQGRGETMAQFLSEWDMNADGRVMAEDVSLRRAALFDMFDLNGDGVIDAGEQVNMASTIAGQEEANHGGQGRGQGMGQGQGQGQGIGHGRGFGRDNAPGQRIHGAMTLAYNDTDGDGAISASEWAAATPRLLAALDGNGDGQIDASDFGR
ncbi:hypothetical protein [Pararhodobacter aggregans]|uniref:hypothetical protein n=1 Tax=Pararhodobacter aggregans TaxID=404875 RepID=UPI003A90F0AE